LEKLLWILLGSKLDVEKTSSSGFYPKSLEELDESELVLAVEPATSYLG